MSRELKIFIILIAVLLWLLFLSVPGATIANYQDGLTKDQIRTLASIRQIDNYPLYIMTYYGDYGFDEFLKKGHTIASVNIIDFEGCSCFAALNRSPRPSKTTKLKVYLSKKRKLNAQSILIKEAKLRSLAYKQKKTLRLSANIPANIPDGKYFLVFCVNEKGRNNDPNQANNISIYAEKIIVNKSSLQLRN